MIKRYGKFVRKTVKEFMESPMKGEIQAYLEENNGSRNGYYERDLGTRYEKINDLRIPRYKLQSRFVQNRRFEIDSVYI